MSVIVFAKVHTERRTKRVAALYVSHLGPYTRLVEDWYDVKRDARTYAGTLPVVAHPPCGPWGLTKAFCTKQDASLGPDAVRVVRANGGVLEHPAHSGLWAHCRLPLPGHEPDLFGGITVEIDQVWYGHSCRKPTWLYMVGVQPKDVARLLRAADKTAAPTHVVTSGPRTTRPAASARKRTLTPIKLARLLVALAATAKPKDTHRYVDSPGYALRKT